MRPEAILCDIEGTTTSLSFVQVVLFSLSHDRMEEFIRNNWESIRTEAEAIMENPEPAVVTRLLQTWILEDRKDPSLKSIQGKIWKEAYESGKIRSHVYPDVAPNFRKWNEAGIRVCIYSSGSIEAQQLLFRYSESGDLTSYISNYFDTTTGPKKVPDSYRSIATELKLSPDTILFLSDTMAELDAAKTAGMQTTQIVRDKGQTSDHPQAPDFDSIRIEL